MCQGQVIICQQTCACQKNGSVAGHVRFPFLVRQGACCSVNMCDPSRLESKMMTIPLQCWLMLHSKWKQQKITSASGIARRTPARIALPRSVIMVKGPDSRDNHSFNPVAFSWSHMKAVFSSVSSPATEPSSFQEANTPVTIACESSKQAKEHQKIPTASGMMVLVPNRASITITLPEYHLYRIITLQQNRKQ